ASLRLHLAQRPPSPLLPYTTLFRSDRSPIEHYDIGVWQRVMHINVNTVCILTRCLLPLLKQSTDASILFTTSGVGRRGRAFWGAYAASKFAVEGFAQVLADELENTAIRVNTLNPGSTRTQIDRKSVV